MLVPPGGGEGAEEREQINQKKERLTTSEKRTIEGVGSKSMFSPAIVTAFITHIISCLCSVEQDLISAEVVHDIGG
jgi:hypothetical protein